MPLASSAASPGTGGSTNSTIPMQPLATSLGEEIWNQTSGKIDAFVQAVGTAHSLNGVMEILRRHNPNLRVVAAEPAETAVLSGGPKGSHRIEGIGIGFIPPCWRPDDVDEIRAPRLKKR